MTHDFKPVPGPMGYRLSNPCVMAVICLLASLQVFSKTNMEDLRLKSLKLTGYLEQRLAAISSKFSQSPFKIITPANPEDRGCQISILFCSSETMEFVFKTLQEKGVVCDERRPDVIRISPVPLYNSFKEVFHCTDIIEQALITAGHS